MLALSQCGHNYVRQFHKTSVVGVEAELWRLLSFWELVVFMHAHILEGTLAIGCMCEFFQTTSLKSSVVVSGTIASIYGMQ